VSATTVTLAPPQRRGFVGLFGRLYRGETKFDFVRRKRTWFLISGMIILAGMVSLGVRGLNYSIEFVGGTSWQVNSSSLTVAQAKSAIEPFGLGAASIVQLSSNSHRSILVEAKLGKGSAVPSSQQIDAVSTALAKAGGVSAAGIGVEQVGPSWGGQITKKAIEALIVFFVLIAGYISIFFEWKMAAAAIIAVLHDIAVTVGIYSLTGFSVTPDTVVAFLTILGYSLYDTIVVFDRVRDNVAGLGATGKLTYTDVVNLSMNQTLARSINTSLVAILPILAVLVVGAQLLGAVTLQYFGLALFVGLTSGAYSSIFIASPLLAIFKEREGRYRSIREKLESRGQALQLLTPAAVAAGFGDDKPKVRSRRSGTAASGPRAAGTRAPGGGPRTAKPAAAPMLVETDRVDEELTDDLEAADVDQAVTNGRATPPARPAARGGTGAARPGGGSGSARTGGSGSAAARPGAGSARTGGAARNPSAPRPRKKGKRR
jgi:preprotein translocase subunit SecF